MWDLTIHLSWGPTSLLAHCSVSDFDIIFNGLSPQLANIIHLDRLWMIENFMDQNFTFLWSLYLDFGEGEDEIIRTFVF